MWQLQLPAGARRETLGSLAPPFFGFLDGATNISETCDGGGDNNELPKKKNDEDELSFAKRCHQMAKDMHAPRPQVRRGRS